MIVKATTHINVKLHIFQSNSTYQYILIYNNKSTVKIDNNYSVFNSDLLYVEIEYRRAYCMINYRTSQYFTMPSQTMEKLFVLLLIVIVIIVVYVGCLFFRGVLEYMNVTVYYTTHTE